MSVLQNPDGSFSAYDAGGNVIISSTDQATAEQYDARYGNTGSPPDPSGSPGTTVVGGANPPVTGANGQVSWSGGGAGGGGGGGGDVGYNPGAANIALQLAQAAAQQAYLNERLRLIEEPTMRMLDERERERIAIDKARQVFDQTYQQSQVSGYMAPQPGQGLTDRAEAAWQALPPERKTMQAAAAIWQQLVPGLTPEEAARMAPVGADYFRATGQRMPDQVAQQHLTQITGGRVGGQTPTLARDQLDLQRQQMGVNAMLSMQDLQSRLRGPGDWVQYMQAVQSTPPELRNIINQAAGQFRMPTAQPGAASVAGMMGDLAGAPQQQAQPAGPTMGQPSTFFDPFRGPGAGAQVQNQRVDAPGMRTAQTYPGAAPGSAVSGQATAMPTFGPGVTPQPTTAAMIGRATAGWPGATNRLGSPVAQPVMGMQPQSTGLPLANQLPRSFATASPDVQDMILSPYEAGGQSKRQVLYDFEKSLPKYAGPSRGVRRM